jgi:hypothetical protein
MENSVAPDRIDVHHHLFSAWVRRAVDREKVLLPLAWDWTPQHSINDMGDAAVATATAIVPLGSRRP